MQSVRPRRAEPRASWMCPCSESAGSKCLDRLAHGVDPTGTVEPACVLEAHVLRQLRRVVEAGPVGRAMEAEDRLLGQAPSPARDRRGEAFREIRLVLLAVRVPRRAVRPAGRGDLEAVDVDRSRPSPSATCFAWRMTRRPRAGRRSPGRRRHAIAGAAEPLVCERIHFSTVSSIFSSKSPCQCASSSASSLQPPPGS